MVCVLTPAARDTSRLLGVVIGATSVKTCGGHHVGFHGNNDHFFTVYRFLVISRNINIKILEKNSYQVNVIHTNK